MSIYENIEIQRSHLFKLRSSLWVEKAMLQKKDYPTAKAKGAQ